MELTFEMNQDMVNIGISETGTYDYIPGNRTLKYKVTGEILGTSNNFNTNDLIDKIIEDLNIARRKGR
jgi:hypothetical protein